MMMYYRVGLVLVLLYCSLCCGSASADWPQWRYDAERGAVSPDSLPSKLVQHWSMRLPASEPAWPKTQTDLQFDLAANMIAKGRHLLVSSNRNDSVTSYDTRTGEVRWQFFADGPVRFAAAASEESVYFTSDDGFLYCLNIDDGTLRWRVNGGPLRRMVLGNERMISAWPARGAPVLSEGKVYFAASLWPFMGVFVHCVDADTGASVWLNSGDGMNLTIQPHGAPSFATVAPQGHLVVSGDRLIVPGGRSVPAVYDKHTGRLMHFSYEGKRGGYRVFAASDQYFVDNGGYDLRNGSRVESTAPVLGSTRDEMVIFISDDLIKVASDKTRVEAVTTKDRRGKTKTKYTVHRETHNEFLADQSISGRAVMMTGDQVWTADGKSLMAYQLKGDEAVEQQTLRLPGQPWEVIAADDRLFVVTQAGQLICYGSGKPLRSPPASATTVAATGAGGHAATLRPESQKLIRRITSGRNTAGYALVLGVRGGLVEQLMEQTQLSIVAIEPDEKAADIARRSFQKNGRYGKRLSVIVGHVDELALPPYFASLVTSVETDLTRFFVDPQQTATLLQRLRPYGGELLVRQGTLDQAMIDKTGPDTQWRLTQGDGQRITRPGRLPGAGSWTHQYGDATQSGISADSRVKAPLGVLWFGGPSHEGILPRHGHGPAPQVSHGRIVIEGPNLLRCLDVYTGRLLWERQFKEVGKYYDNTRHIPGAGEIGSNYVTMPDNIYVVYGRKLLELSSATGQTAKTFDIETVDEAGSFWGSVAVSDDYLIATTRPVSVSTDSKTRRRVQSESLDSYELVPRHALYKYLFERDPGNDWHRLVFDDTDWQEAESGFGYGDNDDRTTIDIRGKHSRLYLRHAFTVAKPEQLNKLVLRVRYDDGFIAYINGKEVVRASISAGSGSTAKVIAHEADDWEEFEIKDVASLKLGERNVLAIEAHNNSATSSDLTIDPVLIADRTVGNNIRSTDSPTPWVEQLTNTRYASGSRRLFVINRRTGEKLWQQDATFNFRHNAIVAGDGAVFCVDRLSDTKRRALARRGVKVSEQGSLTAYDLATGQQLWKHDESAFGTFLCYSAEHDILLQGGSVYRDRAYDESSKGLTAIRGRDGTVLWELPDLVYGGPCLLWKDRVITNGSGGFAIDILSGQRTGWKYDREYGCNTAIGCQNMLTFRSGAAGFYDMEHDSGTGNLGGFRSSCTNNLIPADGVLAAPDYTRTCTCAYQNQTSLALVHLADLDYWTFDSQPTAGRIGINLGAPGDRKSSAGTLWTEFPRVGGGGPDPKLVVKPDGSPLFRVHSTLMGSDPAWVYSSGMAGIESLTLSSESNERHRLNLYFSAPTIVDAPDLAAERFRFDVRVQGKTVLASFDPVKVAGGRRKGIVKSAWVVPKGRKVTIDFEPNGGQTVLSGVELIRSPVSK